MRYAEPFDEFVEKELMRFPMKVKCAWCDTLMQDGVEPVSHGICGPCLAKMREEDGWPLKGSSEGLSKEEIATRSSHLEAPRRTIARAATWLKDRWLWMKWFSWQ